MAAGRDPVDRIVDLVVATPICAVVATRRALPLLAKSARRLVHEIAVVEPAIDDVGRPHPPPTRADDDVAEEDVSSAAAVELLPIDGYDQLAARQVVDRLASLDLDELELVATYERAHRNRRTVLGRIEQLSP